MKAHAKFVENFIAARHALEMSQKHIAGRMRYRMTGWNTQSVTNFEAGRRPVTLTESEELASLVCVPLDRMLTESASTVARIARLNMKTGAVR